MLKTRNQYIEKLLGMRKNVYVGGEAVGRDDPRLRPGINTMATTYDLAQDAK